MATTVLGMLGVLLYAVAVSGTASSDFDVQLITGKWYAVHAASNAPWFVARRNELPMESITLTPQANGDLLMESSFQGPDGTCKQLKDVAKKTTVPGRFTFYFEKFDAHNVFQVLDVKYDEYIIAYFIISDENERNYTLNRLLSRKKEVKEEVLKKFTKVSVEQGIKSENFATLIKSAPDTTGPSLDLRLDLRLDRPRSAPTNLMANPFYPKSGTQLS
ncbi:lipocalin-like [Salminus brasiliensis]|uniref:lipocalin-like n=1 Tax=Salminus brasiliensis TaxID=930266 RepID=UPI003B8388D4